MSEIPYFVRSKTATTVEDTDALYFSVAGTDVPNKVVFENVRAAVFANENGILDGGTGVDEDVYQLIGGINGVSKNSNVIGQ